MCFGSSTPSARRASAAQTRADKRAATLATLDVVRDQIKFDLEQASQPDPLSVVEQHRLKLFQKQNNILRRLIASQDGGTTETFASLVAEYEQYVNSELGDDDLIRRTYSAKKHSAIAAVKGNKGFLFVGTKLRVIKEASDNPRGFRNGDIVRFAGINYGELLSVQNRFGQHDDFYGHRFEVVEDEAPVAYTATGNTEAPAVPQRSAYTNLANKLRDAQLKAIRNKQASIITESLGALSTIAASPDVSVRDLLTQLDRQVVK